MRADSRLLSGWERGGNADRGEELDQGGTANRAGPRAQQNDERPRVGAFRQVETVGIEPTSAGA